MKARGKTLAGEGVLFGVLAGILFLLAQVAGTAVVGDAAIAPVRRYAGLVLGRAVLSSTADVVVLGVFVHLALSALYGFGYALLTSRLLRGTTKSYAREAGFGLLFGVLLWAFEAQVLVRLLCPWLGARSQPMELAMYAVFFGLPLGLMLAAGERQVGDVPTLIEQES